MGSGVVWPIAPVPRSFSRIAAALEVGAVAVGLRAAEALFVAALNADLKGAIAAPINPLAAVSDRVATGDAAVGEAGDGAVGAAFSPAVSFIISAMLP
jgi:hypothetical protein